MDEGRFYKMTDDPNTEFEKRCYDDKGNNICKATERKGGMSTISPKNKGSVAIIFDDCLSVEVQGVIKVLTDAGYRLEMRENLRPYRPHFLRGEVAVFSL